MATNLKNISLREVSLVESPANKDARVLIFKSESGSARFTKAATGDTNGHTHTFDETAETGRTSTDEGHDHPYSSGDAETGAGGDDNHTHTLPVIAASQPDASDVHVAASMHRRRRAQKMLAEALYVSKDLAVPVAKAEHDDGPMDFNEAMADSAAREQVWRSMDMIWDKIGGLRNSIESIVTSDSLDKSTLVRESIDQFRTALDAVLPSLALTKDGVKPSDNGKESAMTSKELEQKVSELTKQLADMTTERDDAVTKVGAAETAKAEADAKVEKLEAGAAGNDDDGDDDVMKNLPPEVVDLIRKAETSSAENAAELAKMQDEKAEAVFIAKAAEFKHLPIKPEVFGPVLKAAQAGGLDADGYAELERVLKAGDEAMAGVFTATGAGGEGSGGGALAEATARAEALFKEKPGEFKSMIAARASVFKSDPELRAQYDADRKAAH